MSKFTSISADQIERFLEGRCNTEEAAAVSKYLQDNPDVFQYYVQREWQEAATGAAPDKKDSRKMFEAIKSQLKQDKERGGKLIILKRLTAVAAAVIAIAVCSWLFQTPAAAPATAKLKTTTTAEPAGQTPISTIRTIHSNKQEHHQLPDGSSIVLYGNSTITYPEPFEPNSRAVTLEGKALFTVAKDEARPFIVTSGAIETTVLGTEFLVTKTPTRTQIQLFSGKVRLHNNELHNSKDMILIPGEELSYTGGIAKVTRRQQEAQQEETEEEANQPVIEENIAFDNASLPYVLERLSKSYHVQIKYNRQQISNIYFTGNVLTSEPLTTTLHIIASMNDLRIVPEKKGYILRK